MIIGSVPLLTKGPFALFLGGEKMLDILDDGNPGNALPYLILFSLLFQMCTFSYKFIRNRQQESFTKYAQYLRKSLVENVLNIYSVIFILFCNIITLTYILRSVFIWWFDIYKLSKCDVFW